MKKLRTNSVRSGIERRVAVGMTAVVTAMGTTACGPLFLNAGGEKNNEGLKGLGINNSGEAVFVGTKQSGDDVQVDFKAPQSYYGNSKSFDVTSVNCGTYNGNTNTSSVWDSGEGMSCHIDNVGNVSKIRKQVREMLNESLGNSASESQEATLSNDGYSGQSNEVAPADAVGHDIPGYEKMNP